MKEETKQGHTPGPWSMDTCGDPIIINGPKDGRAIVAWVPSELENAGEHWSMEEHANARLIAAAPDLLHGCRCALADLEGIMPDFEPSGDRLHPGWETIRELRAAIAEVEGGGS